MHLTSFQKIALWAFVLLKVLLIMAVPLTGDEAYFIVWGQQFEPGYYDHPPMVGWLLFVLGSLYDHLWFYRAFAFFAAIVIAYVLYLTLRLHPKVEEPRAFWVALAFFVSPISLMFVVTANDTVLVFFALVGFYFFARLLAQPSWWVAIIGGVFLGFAFLSKYFAGFLLLGLFAYVLFYRQRIPWPQMLVMMAIVLLMVIQNLWFNATHCWNNILFNFFSRTKESSLEIENVMSYLLMIMLLWSPLGVYYLLRDKATRWVCKDCVVARLTLFAALPLLGVLLVVSFTNVVGLHWPLISVTLLYLLYVCLSEQKLQSLYRFNVISSLVIGGLLLVALQFVDELISPSQKHHVAVYTQPKTVCAAMPNSQAPFFTLDYSSQSALSYHCENDDVHVFMSRSKYGREDDKRTDFKAMDGQALSIFLTHEKDLEKVTAFFESTNITTLPISADLNYYWIEGHGFNYALYREQILKPVNEAYYTAPEWFPKLTDQACQFKQKYDLP